ncbi:MAG: ribonuclease Y, partial [Arcobacter butzleri]|nr:ribonuclease Y [Aliarcobacter butzleri]
MEYLIVGVIVALISVIITVFVQKKLNQAKFDIYIEEAKAKAKVIEHEAKVLLQDAQIKARKEYEIEFREIKKEYDEMFRQIERKEKELNEHLESELRDIKRDKNSIVSNKKDLE